MALLGMAASLIAGEGAAQETPDLWLVPVGDTVLIHVLDPPFNHYGFVVDRSALGGDPERITEEPVLPVRQPAYAAALLGNDLPEVMQMMETTDELQVLRRMQRDRFTAGVTSLLFRSAATVLGRLYADTTAQAGREYEYRVRFLDAAGEETGDVRSARVTVVDREPTPPGDLEGEAGNNQVDLVWSYPPPVDHSADFVIGFHVERASDGGVFRRLRELPYLRSDETRQELVDRTVYNGVSYRYRVRSVDVAGRVSEPGDVLVMRPYDDRPPATPQDLVTTEGDGMVRLSWRMSLEPDVAGYRVERSTGLDQPYDRLLDELVPVTAPTWTDRTPRGGQQYFYRVVAVARDGTESRPSNAASAVPVDETPPAPPTAVRATVSDRQLTVAWEPSPSDDVLGYHIYRGDDAEHAIRLTTRPHEGLEYQDPGFEGEGLRPGGRYLIRVSAVDHSYNESPVVEITTQIPDDEPPAAPTGLQVRNVEGRLVEVSWSSGGSLDVERYRLTRVASDAAEEVEVGTTQARDALRLRDGAVRTGVHYTYRVVALDSAGNASQATNAQLTFRRPVPPPASRRVSVRRAESGGVHISWERVVDDELVGYRVYRSDIPTGVYEPISELIAPGPALEFVDPAGREDHYYTVRAIDRSGNESRPSPAAQAGQS